MVSPQTHVSVLIGHVGLLDAIVACTRFAFCLNIDLPLAAKAVEIAHSLTHPPETAIGKASIRR
jgi:hypothetical protein